MEFKDRYYFYILHFLVWIAGIVLTLLFIEGLDSISIGMVACVYTGSWTVLLSIYDKGKGSNDVYFLVWLYLLVDMYFAGLVTYFLNVNISVGMLILTYMIGYFLID